MRLLKLAVICLFLACASVSQADIINYAIADDGDGALTCTATWNPVTNTMDILGDLYSSPGHIGTHMGTGLPLTDNAFFQTDSSDTIVTMHTTMDNKTDCDWTDFHLKLYFDHPCALSDPSVENPGWTATIDEQPQWDGEYYVGEIDYVGGPLVCKDTGDIDCEYQMDLDRDTHYCYTEECIRSVPEPASFVLLAGGLLGLLVLRRRSVG